MEDKPVLVTLDPIEDHDGNATIRWHDGSENGDTEKQPIATVYDRDDAQAMVDAWNACQLTGANVAEHNAMKKDIDSFFQILEAHKLQYNGTQAQRIFAEELGKLERKLKSYLKK